MSLFCPKKSCSCLSCSKLNIISSDNSISVVKSEVDGVCTFNIRTVLSGSTSNIAVEDTETIQLLGSGSSLNPLSANVKLSSNPSNIITVDSEGLLVLLPVSAETPNSKTDSESCLVTLSGTQNRNIKVDVRISSMSGNSLTIQSDGLYVPPINPAGLSTVSISDTATLDLSGSGTSGSPLSGTVRISSQPLNAITVNADGLFVDGSLSPTGFWNKEGDAGTDYTVNFLGTTDLKHLSFRTNNILSGRIEVGLTPESNNSGTYLGHGAARVANPLLTARNSAFGYEAMYNFVQGGSNAVFGYRAMYSGTTFSENSAFGNWALYGNTTGNRNVGAGQSVLYQNTNGNHNTGIGTFALELTNGGSGNTAAGRDSLRSNKMGGYNSAFGFFSLLQNTTSVDFITVTNGGSGYTTASVVISAPQAGSPGGISIQATATAIINAGVITGITMIEKGAGYSTSYGPVTVTITGDGTGATATATLISGDYNTAMGYGAGAFSRIGSYNIFIGMESGQGLSNAAPSYIDNICTFIGYGASRGISVPSTTPLVNAIAIGHNSKVSADYTMALGGTGVYAINVGINTETARKKLDVVGGDILVHELTVGKGGGSIDTNTVFGYEAWLNNTTGTNSVVIGYRAGKDNVNGLLNVIIGSEAHNGTSANNVAIGYRAWRNAGTAGFINGGIIIGSEALAVGTGSWGAIGIGYRALYNNTTLSGANVYDYITAVGDHSMYSLTSGKYNTAYGAYSGFGLTTAEGNTAIGVLSMARGWFGVGTANVVGTYNTAVGYGSMFWNSVGSYSIAIGYNALYQAEPTIGSNIGIGKEAGSAITTGNYNVVIGGHTGSTIAGLSNRIILADGQGNQRIYIDNAGKIQFSNYGAGTQTGTATYQLAVDASGNVIEIALGGGGGGSVNSVSGTTNRITSTGGTDPIIDISASYVGQSSITTLGTITTGVWNGTTIAVANGGTGLTALGSALQQLRVNAGGTALEYFTPTAGVTGSGVANQLAFWSSATGITGSTAFTLSDSLYPSLQIGGAGNNDATLLLRNIAGTTSAISGDSGGLTMYGSSTYKGHTFYTHVGGTLMAEFRDLTGTLTHTFKGRIHTDTLQTGGTNLGAFNIDRTFAEAVSGNNQHGYVDKTVFRYGGGAAFNAFYAENTIGATNAGYAQDHWAGFQTRITKDGANTVNHLYDFVALGSLINGGTATNRYGFYMFTANNAGGGTLTNQYGIYIPTLSGATNNWGAYFGSRVQIQDGTEGLGKVFTSDANGIGSWQAASGGVTTFLALTDTPNSYTGFENFLVRVKVGETELEFVDPSAIATADPTLTVSTTNATTTTCGTFPSLPTNVSGFLTVVMTAVNSGANGEALTGEKKVRFTKVGTTITFGTLTDIMADEIDTTLTGSTWTIDDDGAGAIRIRVTGVAATNIDWKATYQLITM